MDAGGAEFAIHQIPQDIAKDIVIADPPARQEPLRRGEGPPRERSQGAVKLVFAVEDFPSARARLEAAGARFRPPNSWDGDGARDFVDPEGNVFRVREA
jgi:hypothetical protein